MVTNKSRFAIRGGRSKPGTMPTPRSVAGPFHRWRIGLVKARVIRDGDQLVSALLHLLLDQEAQLLKAFLEMVVDLAQIGRIFYHRVRNFL